MQALPFCSVVLSDDLAPLSHKVGPQPSKPMGADPLVEQRRQRLAVLQTAERRQDEQLVARSFYNPRGGRAAEIGQACSEVEQAFADFYASPAGQRHAGESKTDLRRMLSLSVMASQAEESGFEGWHAEVASFWWQQSLRQISQGHGLFSRAVPPHVVASIDQLYDSAVEVAGFGGLTSDQVGAKAKDLAERLVNLRDGESYCMRGGWEDKPRGHVMVYRFAKRPGDRLSMYVYNAHYEEEQGGTRLGGKLEVKPCYLFEDIPYEKLFFCNPQDVGGTGRKVFAPGFQPIILKRLLEQLVPPQEPKRRNVHEILDLLSPLAEFLAPSDHVADLYLRLQRTGNCPIKSVRCLLLELMGDKEQYKLLNLDTRFFGLIYFYHKFRQSFDTPDGARDLAMLRRATQNFLGSLRKNYGRPGSLITPDMFEAAFSTANDLLRKLDGHEQMAKTVAPPALSPATTVIDEFGCSLVALGRVQWIGEAIANGQVAPVPPQAAVMTDVFLGTNARWPDLPRIAVELNRMLGELQTRGDHRQAVIQFEATMMRLAALRRDPSMGGIAPDEAKRCLESLDIVFERYAKSVYETQGLASPRMQNVAMEVVALSWCLSRHIDPHLNDYGLNIDHFLNYQDSAYFNCPDPEVLAHRNDLVAFFNGINAGKAADRILFDFAGVSCSGDDVRFNRIAEIDLYDHYPAELALVVDAGAGAKLDILPADQIPTAKAHLFASLQVARYPAGLQHLARLKRTACLGYELFRPGRDVGAVLKDWVGLFKPIVIYEGRFRYWQTGLRSDFIKSAELGGEDYPALQAYRDQPVAVIRNRQSENQLLLAGAASPEDQDLAVSVPEGQMSALLDVAADSLDKFNEDAWRLRWELECLRPARLGDRWIFPVEEELKKDAQPLLAKLDFLGGEAYRIFIRSAPPTSPKWKQLLSIVRTRAHALYTAKKVIPNYRFSVETRRCHDELMGWLRTYSQTPDLPEETKKELFLARIGLLLAMPPAELSLDDAADLFNLMREINGTGAGTLATLENQSFLRECRYRFAISQDLWQPFLPARGCPCPLAARLIGGVDSTYHVDRLTVVNAGPGMVELTGDWSLDLTRAAILRTGIEVGDVPFELTMEMRRLFDDRKPKIRRLNPDTVQFDDVVWGQNITIVGTGERAKIFLEIRRADGNIRRYRYVSADKDQILGNEHFLRRLLVPASLYFGYAHWLSDDGEMLIFNLRDGQHPVFRLQPNGHLEDLRSDPVAYSYELSDRALGSFSGFEADRFIAVWCKPVPPALAAHRVSYLEMPRFSMKGNPLRFDRDDRLNGWVYCADRRYLVNEAPYEPLASRFGRYLDLADKDNRRKHKVLIPVGALNADGFGGVAKVSIPTSANDSSRLSLDYFEYDFNEDDPDKLIPANLEARIYLAHLYLAQKRYQAAAELLRGVSLSDTLSDKAITLARAMLNSSAALSDVSPNACAVRLQSLWLLRRLSPDSPVLGEQQNAMLSIYRKYLHGIDHVEEPLILDLVKEKELFDWFRSPDLAWRLEDFKPAPNTILSTWRTVPQRGAPEGWLDAGNFRVQLEQYTKVDEPALIALLGWDSLPCTKCYPEFSALYNEVMAAFARGVPGRGRLLELVYTFATTKIEPAGMDRNQINLLLFVARKALQHVDFALPLALPVVPPPNDNVALVAWYKQVYALWQGSQLVAGEDKERYLAFTLPTFDKRSADLGPVVLPPRLAAPREVKVSPDELTSFSDELALEQWQEGLLAEAPAPVGASSVPTLAAAIDPRFLSKTEKDYQEGIDQSLQAYLGDCQTASDAFARRRILRSDDPIGMLAYAQREHDRRLVGERDLERLVLLLANRQDDRSLSAAMRQRIERIAKARPAVDLPTVLHAASQGLAALRSLNPSLQDGELAELRTLAVDLMIKATQRQHLARLIKSLRNWAGEIELAHREGRAPQVNPLWRDEVRDLLGQFRTYDPYDPAQEDYFPLFFEYLSGMRLWHSQATIIRSVLKSVLESPDLALRSKVFQRIMAGGKTSVIISSLLEIISQEGKISFVLCHHSQYAGVRGNLHNFQESRYHKDVYSLDYSLRDLGNIEVLGEVRKKLQEADDKKCAILMKSSMPQVLELKYVLDTMELGRITRQLQELQARPAAAGLAGVASEVQGLTRMLEELSARVSILAGINRAFRERGVGFFDECDMTLSMLMEVNVPLGEAEMITPERAELVRAVYQALAVDPRISGLVNLRENRQAALAPEEIRQRIAPVVAEYLFVNYRTINRRIGGEMVQVSQGEMRPRYLAAFVRYLTGRITPADQAAADDRTLAVESLPAGEGRENVEFLRYFAKMHDSPNQYIREAAEQIALARRIIGDVLPLALSHSCNRGYGRDPKQDNGAVIPYLGVNTPAKTRFGYNYLALCYQYQAALNEDITQGEIRFLAEKMVAAAQFYAARDGKNFAETPESVWFRAHTGQELGAVLENPALLRAACVHVNASPEDRLAIEAEVAPFHVETARERVSSNPINLVEQLGQVVACSGTPWNWQTYHGKVGVLEADRGVEGRIINTMLGRSVGREQEALRTVPDDSLESILRQISSHPQRGRLRSLIDAGGFLKGNNNAQVARAILDLYAREAGGAAPTVDSVVYLHQFSEEEVRAGRQPESFVVLKRLPNGTMQMEVLANTSDEEIARCGVDRAKMFVLFDELRATGTDIKMAEDTICLVTVDSRMPVRTILQATLRARGYFQGQDCEYLVTAKGRSEMLNGGQRLSDVVNTLIKNQAVAAGEQTFRRYLAHITNSVRARILRRMMDMDPLAAGNIAQRFRSFFVTGSIDRPFALFARVEDKKDALAVLRDRAVDTLANCCRAALGGGGPEDRAWNEFITAFASSSLSPGGGPFCAVRDGFIDFTPPRGQDHGAFIQALTRSPFYKEIGELVGDFQGLMREAQRDVENKVLPARLEYQQGRELDTQVEVAQEREMAVAVEETREVELSTQLAQEFRGYEGDCGEAAVERDWLFQSAGRSLDFSTLGADIQPVGEVFRRRYAVAGAVGRFAGCFPPNLHMSENLRVVGVGGDIPPLHSKAKRASYLMVVGSSPGQLQFVLLTKRDLQLLKARWPVGQQPLNVWLVNLRGMEERRNDNAGRSLAEMRLIPGFEAALADGLWFANFFNGNVRYLEEQRELSAQKYSAEPANAEMCKNLSDYVLLRAYSHPRLRHFALASKLLRPGLEVRKRTSGVVFGPRRAMQEDLADEVQHKDMAGVATLLPEQVSLLRDRQFQYLRTEAQVAEVPDDKLKFLDPRRQADLLNRRQIARLRVGDVGERSLLQGLRKRELIAAIADPNFVPGHLANEQINLIPPEWLPRLTSEQIKKLTDPALVAQWPRRDGHLWRTAMVPELALSADLALKQWLETNVNGFRELQAADVASWLVPKLSPERVRRLPPNRLRDEITVGQAAGLPAELVGNLLKKEHIEALRRPAQIKAVQPEAVKFLKREQVELIDPGQAQYLTPEQVCWLSLPAMVAGIRHDRDHVAAVSVDCVRFLAPGDENLLPAEPVDAEKVRQLIPRQVNGLRVRELVAALAAGQVARIRSDEVVRLLAAGQVNQIDPRMVVALDPERQLGVLEGPVLVAEVVADRVRFLAIGSRRYIRDGDRLAALPDDNGLEDGQKEALRRYLGSLEVGALIDLVNLRPWLSRYSISRLMRLPEAQYGRLNDEVKGIVVAAVRELDHDSLAARWTDGGLGRHLLGNLTRRQIGGLDSRNADLINNLPVERLSELALDREVLRVVDKKNAADCFTKDQIKVLYPWGILRRAAVGVLSLLLFPVVLLCSPFYWLGLLLSRNNAGEAGHWVVRSFTYVAMLFNYDWSCRTYLRYS